MRYIVPKCNVAAAIALAGTMGLRLVFDSATSTRFVFLVGSETESSTILGSIVRNGLEQFGTFSTSWMELPE